jgi:hypothetical protein
MVIPASAGLYTARVLAGAGIPVLTATAQAVAALYGIASNINDFINGHIEDMKRSSNPTVEKTGRILEMAKFGFGLGYLSSVTIIAVGQYLLGNTLAAVSTLAAAATLSNPIAMTCAAVGAILYGWQALNDDERNGILDSLAQGLEIGVELIKSMVAFVINTAHELFNSKLVKDFKDFIADKAALFGRSLSDVTHLTVDVIAETASSVKRHAEDAATNTARTAGEAAGKIGETLSGLGRSAGQLKERVGAKADQVIEAGRDVLRRE